MDAFVNTQHVVMLTFGASGPLGAHWLQNMGPGLGRSQQCPRQAGQPGFAMERYGAEPVHSQHTT